MKSIIKKVSKNVLKVNSFRSLLPKNSLCLKNPLGLRFIQTNNFEYPMIEVDHEEERQKLLESTPVPPEFTNIEDAEEYIFQQRAQMIQSREKALRERESVKADVRRRLLPRCKKLLAEHREPHIRDEGRYTQEQLAGVREQTRQISNVSLPEIIVDVVGVRRSKCTEEEMVQHIASRGIPFRDEDIVELLALMIDRNVSEGLAAEIAMDVLRPYIGQGRVRETTWRDYLIQGEQKTVLDNIAGRISRALGVPHMPLSMTRIPTGSNPFPQTDEDIIKLVEEIESNEKRPIWGKKAN